MSVQTLVGRVTRIFPKHRTIELYLSGWSSGRLPDYERPTEELEQLAPHTKAGPGDRWPAFYICDTDEPYEAFNVGQLVSVGVFALDAYNATKPTDLEFLAGSLTAVEDQAANLEDFKRLATDQ